MAKIMKCSKCNNYTMKDYCVDCSAKTLPVSYKFKPYNKSEALAVEKES